MAGKAVIDLELEDRKLSPGLRKAEGAIKRFASRAKLVIGAIAIGAAVAGLSMVGREMLELAGKQEQAEAKLQSVLKATENAAGFTADQLKTVASGLQDVTTVGDEVIINGQAILATFKNIRGDVFTEATEAMLDMGAVLDTDVKGAAIQLGKALNDPVKGISALSRAGVSFTEQQKEQIRVLQESGDIMGAQRIILDELGGEFGGAARAKAETFSGQMEQLSNKVGDLWEIGGQLLSEILKPLLPVFDSLVDTTMSWAQSLLPVAKNIGESIKGLMEWSGVLGLTGDKLLEWTITAKVLFTRWKDVIAAALLNAAGTVVEWADTIRYYFTDVIPWAAKSMWSIMKDIFMQLDDLILTVAGNVMANMDNFVQALKSALTGGDFDFKPVSLLEGFELQLTDLPELADKKTSELAKTLKQAGQDLTLDIGGQIAKEIKEAKDAAAEKTEIDLEPKVKPFDIPEPEKEEEEEEEKKEEEAKEEKEEEGNQGATSDLLGLFDKIQSAAAEDSGKQLVNLQQETIDAIMQGVDATKALAQKESPKQPITPVFAPEDDGTSPVQPNTEFTLKRETPPKLNPGIGPQTIVNVDNSDTRDVHLDAPANPEVNVDVHQRDVVVAVDRVTEAVRRLDTRARLS